MIWRREMMVDIKLLYQAFELARNETGAPVSRYMLRKAKEGWLPNASEKHQLLI